MSAYNIELPGVVLAGLYKKAIVQGEGKAVVGGWVAPGAERGSAASDVAQTPAAGSGSAGLADVQQTASGSGSNLPGMDQQTAGGSGSTGSAGMQTATGSGSTASGQAQPTTTGTGVTGSTVAQQSAAKPGAIDAVDSGGSTVAAGERIATGAGMGLSAKLPTNPVSPVLPAAPNRPSAMATDIPKQGLPTDAGFTGYKLLGNNRQQVTVVVRFPGEAFLPESHLQFLTKMIGACKLNLGDVAIVNDATVRVDMNVLKAQLQPKTVLLFGVAPEEAALPLSFPTFKAQEYAGTTYLYTPPLEELNTETEDGKLLKRRLWDSLRKIFGV